MYGYPWNQWGPPIIFPPHGYNGAPATPTTEMIDAEIKRRKEWLETELKKVKEDEEKKKKEVKPLYPKMFNIWDVCLLLIVYTVTLAPVAHEVIAKWLARPTFLP